MTAAKPFLIGLAVVLLLAGEAWAQRDTMRMGESLGAVVLRPPERPGGASVQREDLRPRESLETMKQQAEPARPESRQGGEK
jgi:hypothetical protein